MCDNSKTSLNKLSDAQLIKRIYMQACNASYTELDARHHQKLWHFCAARFGTSDWEAICCDAKTDAFVHWRRTGVAPRCRVATYWAGIAMNIHKRSYRPQRIGSSRVLGFDGRAVMFVSTAAPPSSAASFDEMLRALHARLSLRGELSRDGYEAIVRALVYEDSPRELAAQLRRGKTWMYDRIAEAREFLETWTRGDR